jgi:hypothetical protein
MTAQDCNLTDIGYNLACATTQDAINKTMEFYVENLNGKIDWYDIWDPNAIDPKTNKPGLNISMTAADFQKICPVDPLSVPNGTTAIVGNTYDDGSDQANLISLYNSYFNYGIQAVTGISGSWSSVPNIVVIGALGTTVTYNMYFGTMQVLEVQQQHSTLTMVNCIQPAEAPWIFSYQVNLALADVTDTQNTPPPQSDLFSVQQLYLELNTLIDGIPPSISGVSPECNEFVKALVDEYVKTIPPGQSTIAYTQVSKTTTQSSLVVTNLQYAVIPNDTSPGLGTLNYLCMTGNNAAPLVIKFPEWQWVADDQTSGVMAVERSIFANYLLGIFNTNFSNLSSETTGEITVTDKPADCKGGMTFSYKCPATDGPATWGLNSDTNSQTLANASYHHTSGNQHSYSINCEAFMGSISCDWDYTLTGQLNFSNNADSTVTITMKLSLVSPVHVHFCGKSEDRNVIDITSTINYGIKVSEEGELLVTADPQTTDSSENIPQLNTNCGNINYSDCNGMYESIRDNLAAQIASYESAVLAALQGAMTWYFPGSSSFQFRDVSFSRYGDLTVQLKYLDPTTNGATNPGVTS